VDFMICDPGWLKDRIATHNLYSCFTRFDPNSNSFFDDASSYLDDDVCKLWKELFAQFGHPSEELVLRNLWAMAEDDPESLVVVARIASKRKILVGASADLAGQIHAHLRSKVPIGSWLLFFAACEPRFSLIPSGKHTDAFRLRFQLAILSHQGVSTVEVLKLWPQYPKLSRLAYQRELKRALGGAASAARPWKRIGCEDFNRLTLDEKYLVCSDDELLAALFDDDARCEICVEKIKSDRLRLRDARRILRHYVNALKWGSYAEANTLVNGLSIERIEPELKDQFEKQIASNLRNPKSVADATYSPLTGNALKIAKAIAGNLKVLDVITREPSEIVKALADRKFKAASVPNAIAERLAKKWSKKEIESLCESESFNVVRQIPEAVARKNFVPWIEAGTFRKSDAVMSAIVDMFDGNDIKPEIRALLARNALSNLQYLAQRSPSVTYSDALREVCIEQFGSGGEKVLVWTDDIEVLCQHYIDDCPIADRQAFADKLVSLLASAINRHRNETSFVDIAEDLARKDAVLGRKLLESLSGSRLEALLKGNTANQAWLMPLIDGRPDYQELHKAVSTDRVKVSTSVAEVLKIIDQYPDLAIHFDQRKIAGNTEDSLVLSILSLRRNPAKLKDLGKSAGQERFQVACKHAIAATWITKRERGYLALLMVLGSRWAKVIAAAMASMKINAQAGHKLDHVYHRYELPKDSGGKRPIAAPPVWIKRLQREVLEKILNPLGAHDAAHGFVRGRSIKTNAILHVGVPVVANCDITNCFPSIRWQLVLAALKRDLQATLDSSAISLLVDLCTFEGGLPIGAPTSPALLNRVLVQTDIWLSEAANKRGAVYSRYADDLTFSGNNGVPELLAIARKMLEKIGLKLDKKKTQIFRQGRRQIVTGLVVNVRPSVPRFVRRKVRAAVHAVEQGRNPTWHGVEESLSALIGRTTFVRSINEEEGSRLLVRLRAKANPTDSSDDD
jgi:hypothetical protein